MKHIRQLVIILALFSILSVSSLAHSPSISEGQENIVKRARQLHEIEWTPLQDIYQWNYAGSFKAGTTYKGVPYGQPVSVGGFLGWNVSLDTFANSVADNTTKFYSAYSWYNKIAPYYSTDCSGFASYAWSAPKRLTTLSFPSYGIKLEEQDANALEVGDVLNNASSHVVLVSAIDLDEGDNVVGIEIMEQTPVITALTRYGTFGGSTMSAFNSRYFARGYIAYRNPNRDDVTYTHSCAVPIDNDFCDNCMEAAPYSSIETTAVGKKITLTHKKSAATIYYTTDGSTPTTNSAKYTSPLEFAESTTVRAIAVSSDFSNSRVLVARVAIEEAAAPAGSISGIESGNKVSVGSKLTLSSTTANSSIYYTTDGSEPTVDSAKYSSAITIDSDMTVKAIAVSSGYATSAVTSFPFTVAEVYTVSASAGVGGSVSPKGETKLLAGDSLKLNFTPNSGCIITDVTVNGASVGAVSSYNISAINQNYTVSVSFKDNTNLPFTDVGGDAWYRSAVSHVYKNSLFNGTSDTQFSPDLEMTRGMFVTVLGRLAKVPTNLSGDNVAIINATEVRLRAEASTTSEILGYFDKYQLIGITGQSGDWYEISSDGLSGWIRGDLLKVYDGRLTDLTEGQYYTNYVKWACLTGIASAGGGDFRATQNISRQDMSVMLYNYTRSFGITLPSNGGGQFNDNASISDYATEAVYALKNAGIISGMGDNQFNPLGTATRAQVAQIFLSFSGAI